MREVRRAQLSLGFGGSAGGVVWKWSEVLVGS